MASIIRIKRSTTAGNPSTLGAGELAYSALADNGSNGGDRLYIGIGTETNGDAANHYVVGGKFFTDRLDHTAGTLTASSAIVVDSNSKIDNLKVDNIELDGNTISTTDTNGNLVINPNGTGKIKLYDTYTLPDADGSSGQVLTTNGEGTVSWQASSSQLSYKGDDSTVGTINLLTETLEILGGEGIDAVVGTNTITISAEDATTSNKGVASFADANFTVTSGAVSTKNITIGTSTVTNGGTLTTITGVDELTVDNLNLNGSSITATGAGADITVTLAPKGTGTVDVSSKRITSVATPTQDTDAATKGYVDGLKSGLDIKDSVRAATTANITLSGEQTIDGVVLVTGDRVLVKNQTDAEDNGIYVVASGAWTRSADADNAPGSEVTAGLFTFVTEGTVNADSGWVLSTNDPITLGTTELTFTQFSGAGQVVAGDALTKTGNQLDVVVAASGGIEISGDALQLKSTLAGDGLTYASGVLTVGGTADRITVTADAIDIASTYAGQNTITTVGTIATGTWQGTTVAVGYGGTGVQTFTSNGIVYGNGTGALQVTAAGAWDATNSVGQLLSVNSSGVPTWTNTIDGGTYGA